MSIASIEELDLAYEGGTIPEADRLRVQRLLDTVSARLRVLLPSLVERMAGNEDLTLLAKDAVIQAVIRKLPGETGPEIRSETQGAGPWNTTVTYHRDRTGTFSDEDLTLLGSAQAQNRTGTIRLGLPDWHRS